MNEDASAKATEKKLQDAAHGGAPVAIPAAFDPKAGPAAEKHTVDASFNRGDEETEADRADRDLEGGGKR